MGHTSAAFISRRWSAAQFQLATKQITPNFHGKLFYLRLVTFTKDLAHWLMRNMFWQRRIKSPVSCKFAIFVSVVFWNEFYTSILSIQINAQFDSRAPRWMGCISQRRTASSGRTSRIENNHSSIIQRGQSQEWRRTFAFGVGRSSWPIAGYSHSMFTDYIVRWPTASQKL